MFDGLRANFFRDKTISSENMSLTSVEQLHRYSIASNLARGKVVLEIGFGSNLVVQTARQLVAMDVMTELVKQGRTQLWNGKVSMVGGRCTNIPLATGCVDLVMTLGLSEHLNQGESMIAEIVRVLRPGGVVIIFYPDAQPSSELSTQQIAAQLNPDFMSACEPLLRSKFRNVAVFTQRITLGSYVTSLVNQSLRSDAGCTSFASNLIPAQKEGEVNGLSCVFAIGSNDALPPGPTELFGTAALSLDARQIHLVDALREVAEKDRTISELNMQLLAAQQSIGWKAATRFRKMRDWLLPIGSARRDLYWSVRRVGEVLLDGGPTAVFRRIRHRYYLGHNIHDILPRAPGGDDVPSLNAQFEMWLRQHQLKAADIERMRAESERFTYTPCISIVMPVYNTKEVWLSRAIESVQAQIYRNWELCAVNDASTKSHIIPLLEAYAGSDPRIRVKHLSKNKGIAGASSDALAMATGEFIGLLDHDDELTPDALWEVASRLNRHPELDLVYSDEDKLTPTERV